MSRDLPEFPNLDHLKKQAKVRLRELRERNPKAKLAEAQHLIAREYGFASWAKLKAHVESLPRPTNADPADAASDDAASHGGNGGGLFARFTEKARQMIFFARYWAAKRGGAQIEPEHLLLGLIQADMDLINRLLRDPSSGENIRKEIERRTTALEKLSTAIHIPLSNECKRILWLGAEEADRLRHNYIGTGHLLLGFLVEEGSLATSILTDILAEKGMRLDKARNDIAQFLNEESL